MFGASGFAHFIIIVCPRAVHVRSGFGSSGLRLAYQSSLFRGLFFSILFANHMKNSFVICLLLFSLHCKAQVYRWDIKILIDSEGLKIYDQKPNPATISNLADENKTHRPTKKEMSKGKRANAEKRKVTVTAYIIATGREDDGDYHLVCEDINGGKTLIAEIPNPLHPKLKGFPGLKTHYSRARNEIDSRIGTPANEVKQLSKKHKVKITGIIFFDKIAHGKGHAVNGVEIHPVLGITVLD